MTTRRTVFLCGGAVAVSAVGVAAVVAHDMGSLDAFKAQTTLTRATLRQTPDIHEVLRYATLAPSGHNAQPWIFAAALDRLDIFPNPMRRTPVVDPDDHHLFVSLGCAAENLTLALAALGHPGEPSFNATNGGSIRVDMGRAKQVRSPLFDAIPKRQSTRADYDGRPVSSADLKTLAEAGSLAGVDLILITDRRQIDRISDLVIAGDTAQMSDKAFIDELRRWLRFSPREAMRTGDGLFSATTGAPILPEWLGPAAFDLTFKVKSENDKYARQLASSAGLAVFVGQKEDHEHWVQTGRAAQRFALQATALGLKHAFLNQPVEVASLRPELAGLVGLAGRRPDLVMRFGYGPDLPFSARRSVDAALRT